MKRSFLPLLAFIISTSTLHPQLSSAQDSDPPCACSQPQLVVELGGRYKLDYSEISVCTKDDGTVLVMDRNTGNYYLVRNGEMKGPFRQEDDEVAGFTGCYTESLEMSALLSRYRGILSKTGDKYNINLGGKTYGPFAEVYDFCVSLSRNWFAVVATSDNGEMPKLVTNIPGVTYDLVSNPGSGFCSRMKFDEIMVVNNDKVINLQGRTVFNINPEISGCGSFFISSSNSRYATYDSGVLSFSDGGNLTGCFNPHLMNQGGSTFLSYMYYSPKSKAIMQCSIPF